MGIGSLTKTKAARVIGIDASTNSIAWAVFENDQPIECGEIFLQGATVFDRLLHARKLMRAMVKAGYFKADYIAIEKAIMVRNVETALNLAYVFGVIIGELMEHGPKVEKVAPISWQSHYGVPNLTKAEKDQIQKDFPGKSKTWYSNKGREIRKQRILDRSKTYFSIPTNSDNIGDACGLAYYVSTKLTRR